MLIPPPPTICNADDNKKQARAHTLGALPKIPVNHEQRDLIYKD